MFTDNKLSCNFTPSKRNIEAVNGLPTAPDMRSGCYLKTRFLPGAGRPDTRVFWGVVNEQADALGSGNFLKWNLVSRVKLTMHHEPMGIGKPEISTGHHTTKTFTWRRV